MNSVKIKEIFESVQGEGPYIGYNQLFIRFCGCNLTCNYCDTDYKTDENCKEYDIEMLLFEVKRYKNIHSISLTGGEPLLNWRFLKEFLPLCDKKIYLETNATLSDEFSKIKQFIDFVSADIKLPSASGQDCFEKHKQFFKNCQGKETFAKIVFNENITNDEIVKCTDIAKQFHIPLILQPQMPNLPSPECLIEILNSFLEQYQDVRLIPQVHKFLDLK